MSEEDKKKLEKLNEGVKPKEPPPKPPSPPG